MVCCGGVSLVWLCGVSLLCFFFVCLYSCVLLWERKDCSGGAADSMPSIIELIDVIVGIFSVSEE